MGVGSGLEAELGSLAYAWCLPFEAGIVTQR